MNEELLRKVYDARNNAQELLPPLKRLLHRLSDLREQKRRKEAVELLEQLGNAVNELITYSLFGCQQVGGVDTLLSKVGAMVANGTFMVAGLVGNRKYYDPEDGAMNRPYSIRAIFDLMNSLSKELRRWAKEKTKASESAQGTAKATAGNTTTEGENARENAPTPSRRWHTRKAVKQNDLLNLCKNFDVIPADTTEKELNGAIFYADWRYIYSTALKKTYIKRMIATIASAYFDTDYRRASAQSIGTTAENLSKGGTSEPLAQFILEIRKITG